MIEIFKITTIGTPVFESEMGPDIGYDNIAEYIVIVPEGWDGFDPEDTRSITLLASVDTLGM